MSTSIPLDSTPPATVTQDAARGAAGWLREPLILFLIAGGLLFAVDHALNPTDATHLIVVPPDVEVQARSEFAQSRGREPTSQELAVLRQVWVDNEVMYREGLALQTDKGDDAIRDRVIFKMLNIVDAGIQLPAIDEPGLREWFEAHRDKYDEPRRYSFQEGVPAPAERTEAGIRAFVDKLNSDSRNEITADLRVFKGRPIGNLDDSYGPDFARTLDELHADSGKRGEWHAVHSRDGWHALRIEEIVPRQPAEFAPIAGVVLQDWKDATVTEKRIAEVRKLGAVYKVETGTSAP
jgi:hypothetical protein